MSQAIRLFRSIFAVLPKNYSIAKTKKKPSLHKSDDLEKSGSAKSSPSPEGQSPTEPIRTALNRFGAARRHCRHPNCSEIESQQKHTSKWCYARHQNLYAL